MDNGFFMVFVEGGNAPTVQHDNLKEAEEEAKRLADKCGKKVSILESVSIIEHEEVNVRINSFEAALFIINDYLIPIVRQVEANLLHYSVDVSFLQSKCCFFYL